jgi:hypothetical protein
MCAERKCVKLKRIVNKIGGAMTPRAQSFVTVTVRRGQVFTMLSNYFSAFHFENPFHWSQIPAAMDGEQSRSSTPEDAAAQSTAAPAKTSELREDQIQNAVSFLSHPKVRPRSMQRVLAIFKFIFFDRSFSKKIKF